MESNGFFVSDAVRLSPSASASVSIPTLPAYISRISMHFDAVESTGVSERLNPTVPSAETTSNSTLRKGAISDGKRLRNQRKVDALFAYIYISAPAEHGDHSHYDYGEGIYFDAARGRAGASADEHQYHRQKVSAVGVGVVALKKETSHFSPKVKFSYVGLERSKKKNSTVETTRNKVLTNKTTLV